MTDPGPPRPWTPPQILAERASSGSSRRGARTDRNGVELAVSEDCATVFANPRPVRDPVGTAHRLAPIVQRPYARVLQGLSDRRRGFVYLARQIDAVRGSVIEQLKLPGIGV